MGQFKQYNKFKKELPKDSRKELSDNLFFIRTAITCEIATLVKEEYTDYTDEHGFAELYEVIMTICDSLLLSNNSVYLKYFKLYFSGSSKANDYFDRKYNTCMDWYFMGEANKMLREELEDFKTK